MKQFLELSIFLILITFKVFGQDTTRYYDKYFND